MDTPEISLVVPVLNGRRFIRQAIESCLKETGVKLEILVVDDGSDDDSVGAVSDLNIKTLRHKKNLGIAAALNTGLGAARGKYITVLDCDDWMAPGGLTGRLQYLKTHSKEHVVAGRPAAIVDETGSPMREFRHLLHPDFRAPERLSLSFFRQGGMYPLLTWLFLFERRLCQEVGEFDTSLESAFDCDYLFRVLEKTEIPVLFKPVAFRRWHSTNHSLQDSKTGKELKPRTIDEVIRVCKRYAVPTGGDFSLWENGYATR
jgi:glycosyltransferase involved in cell wall biosynthesis